MELTKGKNGWKTGSMLGVKLPKPIEDVTKTCNKLIDWFKKVGLPFGWDKIETFYSTKRTDEKFNAYYKITYAVFYIKRKSIRSILNPWHDHLNGDETIVIRIKKHYNKLEWWHEKKGEYHCYNYKMSLEDIKNIMGKLKEFANLEVQEKVEFT